jgi:hypothetical protein
MDVELNLLCFKQTFCYGRRSGALDGAWERIASCWTKNAMFGERPVRDEVQWAAPRAQGVGYNGVGCQSWAWRLADSKT